MTITWLDRDDCRDPRRVGGKAARLGRLATMHPVPPGFCLAARSSDDLPPHLRDEIAAAYAHLGSRCRHPNPPVAVRSSAVDEDGETTSFAGLHDTFLNVIGPDAVAQAVRRCLASARSARARYYRQAHGLTGSAPVAVLVQQLIRADVSAVVFSADPRTGRRGIVLINATWGLGESLVSGRVVPDLVTVRTPDMTILERRAGNKATMTVMRLDDRTAPTYGSTTTGTHEVPVPRSMRRELCLTDRQVRQLARLAHRLEAEYGWPVDLECAYQGGELYLLQCRPITTMVKAQQPLSGDQVSAR